MIKRTMVACALAAAALGISACAGGSSGGSGDAGAAPQAQCYATATSHEGYAPFTVQVLGASDCTNIAVAVNSIQILTNVAGFHAVANTGNATGAELCSGTVNGYDVLVYGEAGDISLCTDLGIPAVP